LASSIKLTPTTFRVFKDLKMPRSRNFLLIWLLGAWALLIVGPASTRAQEAAEPKETPKAEQAAEPKAPPKAAEEKPTPWPPAGAVEEKIKSLVLHVPKTWKREEPKNNLRLAEFSIPAAEGDKDPVELTVSSFTGGGGGVTANVDRWIGQFQSTGRKVKVVGGEGHQGTYVLVDLEGTYNMPDGPPILQKTKPLPNARMLGVILGIRSKEETEVDGKKETVENFAVYFIKMPGSKKTVTANEEAFRLAFGAANRSQENPVEIKEEPAAPPAE
jgi:gluconolactonase